MKASIRRYHAAVRLPDAAMNVGVAVVLASSLRLTNRKVA